MVLIDTEDRLLYYMPEWKLRR